MVSVLEIWLKCDDCLLSNLPYCFLQVTDIFSFAYQCFKNRSIQLLWWVLIILKLLAWCFESLGILVQREIRQMHVQIFDVVVIGFLVIVCAESCKTLVAEICFDWINASNEHVDTAVELLLVQNEWIVNVSLSQEFVMECWFWQICELLEQNDTVTSTPFRWFGNEGLSRVLPHMMLKISDLVGQQKRIRHELVINREKSLQSTYNHTKDVFLGKVIHQWVPIECTFPHLDDIKIMVS